MGLDIWFREDILRALRAAEQASATTVAAIELALAGSTGGQGAGVVDPRYLHAYREGYRAALITMATAFGITQPDDMIESADEAELLAAAPARSLRRRFSPSAF